MTTAEPLNPPEGWDLYDGMIPGRVMFVQAFGHGPVFYRYFGQLKAYCVAPGCGYRGQDRNSAVESFRDSVAHLEMVTGTEWTP